MSQSNLSLKSLYFVPKAVFDQNSIFVRFNHYDCFAFGQMMVELGSILQNVRSNLIKFGLIFRSLHNLVSKIRKIEIRMNKFVGSQQANFPRICVLQIFIWIQSVIQLKSLSIEV